MENKFLANLLNKKNNFVANFFYFGAIFACIGWFLIDYNIIRPVDSGVKVGSMEITATGNKNGKSKGSEVWFYGVYDAATNVKIPWNDFSIDSGWEARDETYVSYKSQPNLIKINFNKKVRLDFGVHPYSGIVSIKLDGHARKVDLYSEHGTVKTIFFDSRDNYKKSSIFPFIVVAFFCFGLIPAILCEMAGWKSLHIWLAAALVFASVYASLSVFFPGVYTNDSADQLRQALSSQYDDWHPPVMAWFWSTLINLSGQVESLFVFHLCLLLAAGICWVFVFEKIGLSYASIFVPCILASPVITNFSGVVWKDVGYAYSMFTCCGILALSILEKKFSIYRCVIIVLLLSYAFGIRSNGIFAIMPIIFFGAWLLVRQISHWPSIRTVAIYEVGITCLVVSLIASTVQFFSYQILNAEKRYPIQYLEMFDLAGISEISGKDYFPDYVKKSGHHDIRLVEDAYRSSVQDLGNANNILFVRADGKPSLVPLNNDEVLQGQLKDAWLNAVRKEPVAYFRHRLNIFKFLMGRGSYSQEKLQSVDNRSSVFDLNLVPQGNVKFPPIDFVGGTLAKEFIEESNATTQGSFLYSGWYWLCALLTELLIGLFAIRLNHVRAVVLLLSSSGLLYILPYFFVAPASDFRYLYWASIAGAFNGVIIISLAGRGVLMKLFGNPPIFKAA